MSEDEKDSKIRIEIDINEIGNETKPAQQEQEQEQANSSNITTATTTATGQNYNQNHSHNELLSPQNPSSTSLQHHLQPSSSSFESCCLPPPDSIPESSDLILPQNSANNNPPKKLKKFGKPPSRPRLSIDALGPLIVDRTELQSPITLEHEIPEVAKLVVASIQVDLEKKREASNRNLATLLATNAADLANGTINNHSSSTTNSNAVPSFITQVTQSTEVGTGNTPQTTDPPSFVTTSADPPASNTNTNTNTKAKGKAKDPKKASSLFRRLFPCFCLPAESPQPPVSVQMTSMSSNPPHNAISSPPEDVLLPPPTSEQQSRKCLVLDLDETLLHSSFKPVKRCDFTIPVEIDNVVHTVYVLKRPFVEQFLEAVATQYEVVVFTASLSKYADPVLDILDPKRLIQHRLFRESCTHLKGNYIKDLARLGRSLESTVIIDNSPTCYMLQPANAVPITSWFDDANDRELVDLLPFLADLTLVDDVREVLSNPSVTITPAGTTSSSPSAPVVPVLPVVNPASTPSSSPITQFEKSE